MVSLCACLWQAWVTIHGPQLPEAAGSRWLFAVGLKRNSYHLAWLSFNLTLNIYLWTLGISPPPSKKVFNASLEYFYSRVYL